MPDWFKWGESEENTTTTPAATEIDEADAEDEAPTEEEVTDEQETSASEDESSKWYNHWQKSEESSSTTAAIVADDQENPSEEEEDAGWTPWRESEESSSTTAAVVVDDGDDSPEDAGWSPTWQWSKTNTTTSYVSTSSSSPAKLKSAMPMDLGDLDNSQELLLPMVGILVFFLVVFCVTRRLCCVKRGAEEKHVVQELELGELGVVQENSPISPRALVAEEGPPKSLWQKSKQGAGKLKKGAGKVIGAARFGGGGGAPCDLCGLKIPSTEIEKDKGKCYHKECYRCASCHRSLRGVPYMPVDDCLYCDEAGAGGRGGRSCFRKLAEGSNAHKAIKHSVTQGIDEDEIKLVASAKVNAIEVIGDELEDIISNMAPKCALCGAGFGPKDNVICQGMVKLHKDCSSGVPGQQREVTMTPGKACASTPGTLLLKVQAASRVLTFFMTKEPSTDKKSTKVTWRPDTTSHAKNAKSCCLDDLQGKDVKVRAVGELGADLADPVKPTVAKAGNVSMITAVYVWKRHGLNWDLRVQFTHDGKTKALSALTASLEVGPAT